ncbi:hypothetical protein FRC01_006392 [Tulasnella sp. 417]|nr:hypothetical protein FRC01_006392 [Tulasnella sp. 417]
MAYPRQSHPWHLPYATQFPDDSANVEVTYPAYPYIPMRPPSPSQVNPYSPEQVASPGFSDADYSVGGSTTTPELDPTGPSSFDSPYSPPFSTVTTPQSDVSPLNHPVSLKAMEIPADSSIRPEHTVNNMIKGALNDSPLRKLPSRGIVGAIIKRFPYYMEPGRQKKLRNTVRHHLSNTKGFVHHAKDANMKGKGDYWTFDPEAAQAAKAKIDASGDSSAPGPSRKRSPSAGASSPYPRTRRARGTQDTIVQRSAAATSSQGPGPIRVSPKVRATTRLALPDDRLPSNPRPIRPSTGPMMGTRLDLQPHPSHGLWSARGQISYASSSPGQSETVLAAPGGLSQRDIADLDGFVHTSFSMSPPSVIASSPSPAFPSFLQLPLPQVSASAAENSLLQAAAMMDGFYPVGMPQTSSSSEPTTEQLSELYLNLDGPTDFPAFEESFR